MKSSKNGPYRPEICDAFASFHESGVTENRTYIHLAMGYGFFDCTPWPRREHAMPFIIVAIAIGWFIFGDPAKTVANYWWADRPAPWEEVDGYYYPDNTDLSVYSSAQDLSSLQGCRDWAYSLAAMNNDPVMARGDYECGAGKQKSSFGLNVYRITVQ